MTPKYQLIGGPLDGAMASDEAANIFPDGTLSVRIDGHCDPQFWLLYRGEVSFTDAPTRLEFIDWMPVNLHPISN